MSKKWDLRFIELAKHVATWSKDPSTQCGCVIVDGSRRILSTGFNGFPAGVADVYERLHDREVKYRFVAHSEVNAICTAARVGVPLVGSTLYVNAAPCSECMKAIIQAGIVRVVWPKDNPFETGPGAERWKKSIEVTELMAVEARVQLERIE